MKLHLRAADWYEANGSPAMAVEHLLNTNERDRCVKLVTALVLPTYQAGHLSTVQRWLSALGDSAIEEYPPLAVLAGYIAVFTGQTAEAQRWAAVVDAASFDLVPADGTASFDSARAMFRAVICAAGPEQMMTDELRRRARAAVERLARHGALLWPRRICSPETLTRRVPCSQSRPPWPPQWATPIRSSTARPSSRCWPWIAGDGRRRPGTWNWRSPLLMSIGCMTTSPACSPSPSRPGSLCTVAT